MKKWLMLVFAGLLVAGCTPQYETRYELIPPAATSGLACLKGCEAKAGACNQQCSQQYAQCSVKAEQQARRGLPDRLQEYQASFAAWKADIDRYKADLRFYQMELDRRERLRDLHRSSCQRDGEESHDCRRYHRLWRDRFLLNDPDHPSSAPDKPTLASETARIRDLICNKDCQCGPQYRQCYASCGGTVKPYQFCVKNCPK